MARGTVYIDASIKDDKGNVVVYGRAKLGMTDVINPRDLGLSTIKAIGFTTWDAQYPVAITGTRYISVAAGSIGSYDTLSTAVSPGTQGGNYVRVEVMRLRETGSGAHQRTSMGTHPGSTRMSYWAVGR